MLSELSWQTLTERCRNTRLVMFYKIHYYLVPICMPLTLKYHPQATWTENRLAYIIPPSTETIVYSHSSLELWETGIFFPQGTVDVGTVEAYKQALLYMWTSSWATRYCYCIGSCHFYPARSWSFYGYIYLCALTVPIISTLHYETLYSCR